MNLSFNALLAICGMGVLAGCIDPAGGADTAEDLEAIEEVGVAQAALDLSNSELSCEEAQRRCYAGCSSTNTACMSRCDAVCPDIHATTCAYQAATNQCFVYGCIGSTCEWTEYSTASGNAWSKCSCFSLCDVTPPGC